MLALALAFNCEARPPDHHQDTGAPLAVAVGGCTALFQPAICLRMPGPGPLVLWTDEPWPARTTWSMTWRTPQGLVVPLEFTTEFTTDSAGTAWVVHAPITSGHVELRGSEGRSFTLEIRTLSEAYAAATTPTALSAEARGPIRALWTALDLDPHEGYMLDCIDAQSNWTTDAKAPSRLAKAANEIGDVSCRAKAHRISAPKALDTGQYKIVAADLEVLRTAGSLHLESRVYADYFAGVLELRRGQLDLSLVSLKQLADFAARVEMQAERESVFTMLALVYFRLGYYDRARELEADLRESTWVPLKSNLLWLAVLRREVDPKQTDPVPEFEALLVEPELAAQTKTAQNFRLNLAFALTQNKEFDAAGKLLAELDRSEFDLDDHVFASIADARVAAGHGELPKARTILSTALERASQGPDAEHELRVLYERAQLEVDAGEFASGREYYAKAEATTQQRLLEFGPSADLSALSGIHTHPRARYLQLLFDLGDFDELRCVMLGARARHYQQLATRSEALDDDPERVEQLLEIAELRKALETDIKTNWDATSDDLDRLRGDWAKQHAAISKAYSDLDKNRVSGPPTQICAPETEHGRLLMHPGVGKTQWMFAFESKQTLDVFTLERGEQSLAEFVATIYAELDSRGHLDPLEQLTVVPVRELIAADFHTPRLPLSVRYSLGLGPPTTATHTSHALVYSPTSGELPGAEDAAADIDMRLGQAGWSTARELPAALDAQQLPELFVYAGHGELAGDFGWDSRLVFGDEQELTSAKVIAYRWGPSVVVLGACDGGTASGAVVDGGMNMAMAFILAGSDLVVASDEPVPDRAGAELLRLLFAEPPTSENAGAELQQALTRAQAGDPGEYASWRVWVR
ncbi:CHAT domain-containing protein [Nannocystaceae bacterium ST9]